MPMAACDARDCLQQRYSFSQFHRHSPGPQPGLAPSTGNTDMTQSWSSQGSCRALTLDMSPHQLLSALGEGGQCVQPTRAAVVASHRCVQNESKFQLVWGWALREPHPEKG